MLLIYKSLSMSNQHSVISDRTLTQPKTTPRTGKLKTKIEEL